MLETKIATLDGQNALNISLADCLRTLHLRRRLGPLLREAVAENLVLDAARRAGLQGSPGELQRAADHFRYRHGLTSAEKTRAWLDQEGLSADDLEEMLERDLLRGKFQDYLVEPRVADQFANNPARYGQARLRQVVVASEGMARELLAQIQDEGREFAELAREHSLDNASRLAGGSLGLVPRWALPPDAAAAVFAARPGDVAGPVAGPQGFHLFLVEEIVPPALDKDTAAAIRREVFDAWLRDRLREARLDLSWLEGL